uniref:U3 small nucleolar RNA-associated protein 25-like n=1 Tax=Cicer arietinum TaxID=3827 RepID=A0A1S3DY62_CICAR|nr:U3 small nucleolar RNA-associated protein 25-like [Cicer arietinum]
MLYTERSHFYHRYKIRGVQNLIIYSLPERKEIYPEVGWNESGQPIDPNNSMFVSYIGAVVRQNIPITIDDWRNKALKDAKDILWNDIQINFLIHSFVIYYFFH